MLNLRSVCIANENSRVKENQRSYLWFEKSMKIACLDQSVHRQSATTLAYTLTTIYPAEACSLKQ